MIFKTASTAGYISSWLIESVIHSKTKTDYYNISSEVSKIRVMLFALHISLLKHKGSAPFFITTMFLVIEILKYYRRLFLVSNKTDISRTGKESDFFYLILTRSFLLTKIYQQQFPQRKRLLCYLKR